MHREPHGWRIGLRRLNAVADVRCDLDPVAGLQVDDVAALEAQRRGAAQQHDELVVGLIVPEARGTRLAGRDDALDAQAGLVDQKIDLLLSLAPRQRLVEVAAAQDGLRP